MSTTPSYEKGQNNKPGNDSNKSQGSDTSGAQGSRWPKRNDAKPKGNSNKVESFSGHTEDLKKYVITDNAGNKATQYKEMHDRMCTYASRTYSANVASSIERLESMTMLDFMPKAIDKKLYMKPKVDKHGAIITDEDGVMIMEEDEDIKQTLTEMRDHQLKNNTQRLTKYEDDMRAMYWVVLGQMDDNFKEIIEGQATFERIKQTEDAIGLLKMIRDLCYREARSKVHRITNLIRTMRKLLTSRQKGDDSAGYAREVIERFNVLKSVGGSLICDESLAATLELEGKTLVDYKNMTGAMQQSWQTKAEQAFVSALIIEGSNEETSILRQRLGLDFAMGNNLYPTTTSRAIEMMNEFKNTKAKKQTSSQRKGTNHNGGGHKGQPNKQVGSISVTQGEVASDNDTIDDKDPDKEYFAEGTQVLMAALDTDECFNNEADIFVTFGQVHYDLDNTSSNYANSDEHSSHSNSSEADWAYWAAKDEADIIPENDVATPTQTPDIPDESILESDDHPPPTPPLLPDILLHGRSEFIETKAGDNSANTTLTADSVENESEESSGQKRKATQISKPDPPGTTLDTGTKPRSEDNNNAQNDAQNRRSERHRHATRTHGWNNLAALDLAITKWQSKSFMEPEECRYSAKVERLFAQHRGGIDPNWILLDSESSVNLITNEKLLTNIRKADNGSTLTVHCNAGSATTDKVGDLKGFGTVWFYKKGIANVISLGLVTNRYRVTMDSDVDNALYVHRNDGGVRRFSKGSNNLYYYDTRDALKESTLLAITTVEGQKKLLSGVDRKRAERAYKLQEIVGFPSDADFLKMIDSKILKNCATTRRDVLLAREIYGRNRASLQGKTVRRQVPHTREDCDSVNQEILKHYKEVTLCCDIFHVNGVRFFGTISKHIKFRTVRAIGNARKSTLVNCMKSVIGQYTSRGFVVKTVFADNQFECVRDSMIQMENPVVLNTTAKDEHEPVIERSIRTIKERVRCGYNSTPFKHMPVRMVAELVYSSVFWLNSHMPKDGVSNTLSPREIMTGYSLDATRHARYQFGEGIMAHVDETNNTMDPRASECIYLRPTGNRQGGFFAFDLSTGRRVNRMHGTAIPLTDLMIKKVAEIARAQGAPQGLVFGDRNNHSTVHDFNEEEIEEDDNVSDSSYKPEEDEKSTDSTLTDVTTVTEITDESTEAIQQAGEIPGVNEPEPDPNNMGQGEPDEQAEESDTEIREVSDADDNDAADDVMDEESIEDDNDELAETADIIHNSDDSAAVEVDNEQEHGSNETNDDAPGNATATESEPTDIEEGNNGPDNEQRKMSLRPTVRRTHNKYGSDEGFAPTVLHRGTFITAGYGPAVRKMAQDEIGYINAAVAIQQYSNLEASHVTKQYGVRQGIKIFGEDGVNAVLKELKQIHDRTVVVPVDPASLTKEMRDKALPYLMFLKRKRCGKIKGRGCADGRRQREFISKEEASSPTVSLYALMISCLIDAIEERDVATADIPGAFLQTDMPDDEEVYIRLEGTMAELLCRLDPKLYAPCMIERHGKKLLYARAKKAIYGTLRAALLFWENLSGTLSSWGFEANPYDRCTMNKIINGKQATICWHVDDLKISHKDPAVVTEILNKLNKEFGQISPLTITRGKIHDYVGMTIDYTDRGKVKFSMFDYLEEIIQGLPREFVGEATSPAGNHLFTINEDGEQLDTKAADKFHHYVAKLLFMAKRTRPDIATAVAFLCTRVKGPDTDDWKKLGRVMKYLQSTPFLPLCLGWDGTGDVKWFVDASFAVHKDMRSHTGGLMTLGQGAVISLSTKQKINTKSSTEAELVGVDDIMNVQVWSRYFLDSSQYEHAGVDTLMKKDRLYQDNTSSIKLETNGKASSTRRTRHIAIRYFFVTDRVKSGNLDIEYCPTEDMVADFFTKPLQGKLFRTHRNMIQGVSEDDYLQYKDAYFAAKKHSNKPTVQFIDSSTGK